MSEQFDAFRADIVWEANTGQAIADVGELGETYLRTTGAMSDEALRLSAAQDRLTKAIARSGPESTAAKAATLNYRRELAALRAESQAAAQAERARGNTAATVAEQAKVSIASTVAQRRELVALAAEYQRVARAAVAGSEEQVAAAKLAERALLQLNAANARSGGAVGGSRLSQEERTGARLGRGALAGAGVSGELSRALVFGSTAFVGAYGLASVVKSVSDAATEQAAAESQLETALRNRGQAIEKVRGQIQLEVAANAQLGFGEADTTKALTLAVTATGSLTGATRLLSVAHNVARAKGTDLATATQLLVRAFEGQSRSLKALGIDVKAGTKGYEILDQVQGKYAGRAVAYANTEAGARERLRAELERTKVTIGNELLPVEDKLATSVANYLGKAGTQEKIQRDVNTALKVGGDAVHTLETAYQLLEPPVARVVQLLGGVENVLKILLALKVASVLSGWANALGGVSVGLRRVATAEKAVAEANVATELTGIGGASVVAAGEVGTLRAALLGLGAPEVLAAIAAAYGAYKLFQNAAKTTTVAPPSYGPQLKAGESITNVENDIGYYEAHGLTKDPGYLILKALKQEMLRDGQIIATAAEVAEAKKKAAKALAAAQKLPPPTKSPNAQTTVPMDTTGGGQYSPPGKPLDRLTQIQLELARAQVAVARGDKGANAELVKALKDQIDYDRKYEQIQEGLLKTDVAHRAQHAKILQGLYADEQSAEGQITSIQQAEAQKSAEARRKQLEQQKAADAKKRKDYQDALNVRESTLKRQVAGATTVGGAKKAEDALTAFYKKESEDARLTRVQREHYATLAQKERAAEVVNLRKIQEKNLENSLARAKLAVEKAKGDTAATATAIAAEKKSLDALIKFYDAEAHNRNLTVAARQEAKRKEIAEQTALAALDNKSKSTTSSVSSQDLAQFLTSVQQILGKYAPDYSTRAVSTGLLETRGFETVTELRRQTAELQRMRREHAFPGAGWSHVAADMALA